MSKAQLTEIVRENIEFARTGTIRQADEIGLVPVAHYFDEQRWQQECDRCELRHFLGDSGCINQRELRSVSSPQSSQDLRRDSVKRAAERGRAATEVPGKIRSGT